MKSFFMKRLREPSTWAGIIALAVGLGGFKVDEEQRQALIQIGLAVAGVLFVFTREQTTTGEQIAEAVESITETPPAPDTGVVLTTKPAPTPTVATKAIPTRGLVGRVNRNKR